MTERQSTTYNQLIGRIDGSYYFLDDIFTYGDDFQGATATIIEPVTRADYDEVTDEDNVREYLRDIWTEAVSSGDTELGLDGYVEDVLRYEEAEDIVYGDIIDDERTEDLRKRFALSLDEYPIFIAVGGGRSFSKGMKWDEVYNQELLDKIEEVEK